MNSFLLYTFLTFLIPRAFSQSTGQAIIPSTLPACAQQCANLLQAQTACTAPPNPPPGGTYGLPCFCGFAPLANLKADAPANICATCSTDDNAAIQSWYKGACSNGGQTTSAANGRATSAIAPSSTASRVATPKPTTQGTTVTGHPANAPNVTQPNW